MKGDALIVNILDNRLAAENPDFLSYALSKGRSVAIASAAGVAVGDLVAMTASLLGLGAIVLASATAFTILKWVGAAYLIWLGVKLIRSAPTEGLTPSREVTSRGVFGHAAAVTALNAAVAGCRGALVVAEPPLA